jgi:hypothetical protein
MSRWMTRSLAVATFVAGGVAAGAAPASAYTCVGTERTVVACVGDPVTVYSDCVYAGRPPCTQVTVTGPLCIYGTIGNGGQFQTTWC